MFSPVKNGIIDLGCFVVAAKAEGSNQKFACSACSKEFLTLWLLRCHAGDHGEQQYVYCEVCDAAYLSAKDLNLHYGIHGQKKFACKKCYAKFFILAHFTDHLRSHSNKPHQCECGNSYSRQDNLFRHQGKKGSYGCTSCEATFELRCLLALHRASHDDKRFECEFCGRKCSTPGYLKQHLKTVHSTEKSVNSTEKSVNSTDKSVNSSEKSVNSTEKSVNSTEKGVNSTVNSSEKSVNSTDKSMNSSEKSVNSTEKSVNSTEKGVNSSGTHAKHQCDQCGKVLSDRSSLKRHVAAMHSTVHKCDCGKVFSSGRLLAAHKKTHVDKKFQCEFCDKTYAFKYKLDRHVATHGEKKFQCEQCGEKFWGSDELKRHISRKCAKNPYKCEDCGNRYRTNGELDGHSVAHEVGDYECKICEEKRFPTIHELALHSSRVHKRQRPYQCTECEKDFAARSKFYLHMETHGEKRFVCKTCDKSFFHLRNFREHGAIHKKIRNRALPKFHCEHCDCSFMCEDELEHHGATHGERKYVCEVCGERFFYPDVYERHKELHQT